MLGRKLGCRVSIRSTSSHTTLTRTGCCRLSSLGLSAEQWQLSTIRFGQFPLPRLVSHRTRTQSKRRTLMVEYETLVNSTSFRVKFLQSLQTGIVSFYLPSLWGAGWLLTAVSPHLLLTTPGVSVCEKVKIRCCKHLRGSVQCPPGCQSHLRSAPRTSQLWFSFFSFFSTAERLWSKQPSYSPCNQFIIISTCECRNTETAPSVTHFSTHLFSPLSTDLLRMWSSRIWKSLPAGSGLTLMWFNSNCNATSGVIIIFYFNWQVFSPSRKYLFWIRII